MFLRLFDDVRRFCLCRQGSYFSPVFSEPSSYNPLSTSLQEREGHASLALRTDARRLPCGRQFATLLLHTQSSILLLSSLLSPEETTKPLKWAIIFDEGRRR